MNFQILTINKSMQMKSNLVIKIFFLCLVVLTSCSKGLKLNELVLKDKLYYNTTEQKPYTGKVYVAYLSGNDSLVANIDSGLFHGNYLLYYPTGEIKDSVIYEKGVIVKYKRFEKNGSVLKTPYKKLCTKNDLTCLIDVNKDTIPFSGLALMIYSDKSRSEDNYINGQQNGKSIYYYEKGNVSKEGNYENGFRIGKWIAYYENHKIKSAGNYRNNEKDSTWTEYYENGRIKGTANYSDGIDNGPFVDYYENGNVKLRGSFQNQLKDGDWTWYYPNGGVEATGKYKHGKSLRKCDCCGKYYVYEEGWSSRNPGFSSAAWEYFANGGAGGGPYCSKACAINCE